MFYCRSDSLWIMKIVSTACLTIITAIFYLSSCKATLTSIFSFSGRVLLSPPRMSPLLRCATGSAQRGKREASRPEVVKEKATKRITRIRKMQMKKSVPNKPDGDMINISTIDVPELLDHWMRQLRSHLDPSSFTGKDVNNSRNMSSIALTTYRNVFNTLGDERVARVVLRCILSPPEIDRKEDIKSEAFVAQVHHLASDIAQDLAEATRVASNDTSRHAWSDDEFQEVGESLLLASIHSLNVPNTSVFPFSLNPNKQSIRRNKHLLHRIFSECYDYSAFSWILLPRKLPMDKPPIPWVRLDEGGFPHSKACCIKLQEDYQYAKVLQDDSKGRLHGLFEGLNALGETAWSINSRVLKVAHVIAKAQRNREKLQRDSPSPATISVSNNNYTADKLERFLVLPPLNEPHDDSNDTRGTSTSCDKEEYEAEMSRHFEIRQALQMASYLEHQGPFYMPYAADFRGRAYPMVPYLCPTGNSFARSLLSFHKGRKLGSRGLFWLKVQLANSYGWGKKSLQERINLVNSHISDIKASATHPLEPLTLSEDGARVVRGWWRAADSPWLCLAACFELSDALNFANSSHLPVSEFVSHLPVMMDGSCNGLQHYAALGRDPKSAYFVNLCKTPRPIDAYAILAQMVNDRVEADCDTHPDAKTRELARNLAGKVLDRRLFKRPVMTSVYGVTPFGLRRSLMRDLHQLRVVNTSSEAEAAAGYLSQLFVGCFRDGLFSKTKEIQLWLKHVAREVSVSISPKSIQPLPDDMKHKRKAAMNHSCGISFASSEVLEQGSTRAVRFGYPATQLSWTAPTTGLPVQLPYLTHRSEGNGIQRCNVDIRKQVNSFPANFIHCLDAGHMYATAIACKKANISFASVHDCFWTHAGSAEKLGNMLREEFVKLYSRDNSSSFNLLNSLRNEMIDKYGDNIVPVSKHCEDRLRRVSKTGSWFPFDKNDWRPIEIPKLPFKDDDDICTSRLLNISRVLDSKYFFH